MAAEVAAVAEQVPPVVVRVPVAVVRVPAVAVAGTRAVALEVAVTQQAARAALPSVPGAAAVDRV